MLTKKYYIISEVSQILEVPIPTLRYWETEFERLKPMRVKNRRHYTVADINIVREIKELLWVKKVKVDAAKKIMQDYRKYPPRRQYLSCKSMADAIRLLSEAKRRCEDAHALVRIDTVLKYLENK